MPPLYRPTVNKKEIDFILRVRNEITPIEVKLNFGQFSPTAINYFNAHYQLDDFKVIGLHGEPRDRQWIYPWQV